MFISMLLVDILVKATLLLSFVSATDRLMVHASAAVKHRLWGISFILLLLLPILSASIPQWRLAVLPNSWVLPTQVESNNDAVLVDASAPAPNLAVRISQPTDLERADLAINTVELSRLPAFEADSYSLEGTSFEQKLSESGVVQPTSIVDNSLGARFNASLVSSILFWLAIFWLFGVVVSIFPLLAGIFRTHHIKRTSKQINDPASASLVSELCRLLGIHRRVSLLECQQSLIPMTWGIRRPTVVLPHVWRDWMAECQRHVLLHELAHVKRFDVFYHLIARIACSLYWFHPLVWVALGRLRTEREMACDDCVLMVGERPSSYAQQLLNIARDYHSMDFPPAVAMTQRTGLERRIRALLDKARSHLPVTPHVGLALLAGGLAFSLLLAAIRLEATADRSVNESEEFNAAQATTPEESSEQKVQLNKVEKLVYEGKVVDANKVPVEGAKLFLVRFKPINFLEPRLSPVARTDANGQFKFEANAKDLTVNGDPDWMISDLFASKEGWGIAAAPSLIFESTGNAAHLVKDDRAMSHRLKAFGNEKDLQLAIDDQPLEGQVINVDGQPVPNATIRLKMVGWHPSGTLDEWAKATSNEKADYFSSNRSIPCYFYLDQLDAVVPPVKTDDEGRFTMRGIGRNRIVDLTVSNSNIESETIHARTQDGESISIPYQFEGPNRSKAKDDFVYLSRRFTHVAAPSVPIVGRVTDIETGEPIAGCVLHGSYKLEHIRNTTDADGRFQIVGMPLEDDHSLYLVPPKGSSFLQWGTRLTLKNLRVPLTLDVQLRKGVVLSGRAVDGKTGGPISGIVKYHVLAKNPNLKQFNGVRFSKDQRVRTSHDGSFSIPAIPGEGVLSFFAMDSMKYRRAARNLPIGTRVGSPEWEAKVFHTLPYILDKTDVHFYKELDVPESGSLVVDVSLNSGESIRGKVLETNGAFATDAIVWGTTELGGWDKASDGRFTIDGYYADSPRKLYAYQQSSKTSAVLSLSGEMMSGVEIRLQPAVTLRGRVVGADGLPISNIVLNGAGVPTGGLSDVDFRLATDNDGRFEIPGLVPGESYTIYGTHRDFWKTILKDFTVEGGAVQDVGDVSIADQGKSAPKSAIGSNSSKQSQSNSTVVAAQQVPIEKANEPKVQPAKSKKLVYEGTVVDPEKKPIANAKLYFVFHQNGKFPDTNVKPLTTTDASGRFKFEVDPDVYGQPGMDDWKFASLFASKEGWGVGTVPSLMFETTGGMSTDPRFAMAMARWNLMFGNDKTLKLVRDDQPLEGRIVDIDGQPVAGATLRVKEIGWNDSGTLDEWEKAVKHEKADYYSVRNAVPILSNGFQLASVVPSVKSNDEGRFTMRGIGNNRIVELLVSGPSIETVIVKARTRDGEIVTFPHEYRSKEKSAMMRGMSDEVYHPRTFTYVAAPSIPIVGRITDVESGEPIPNCLVAAGRAMTFSGSRQSHIVTTTDADGRYQLNGMPLDDDGTFYVVPPNNTLYPPWGGGVKLKGQRDPVNRNVSLRKGVPISGRAIDGKTGEPISGVVEYYSLVANKRLNDFKGFANSGGHETRTDRDGNFSIVAIPGDGVLAFQALEHTKYRRAAEFPMRGTVLSSPSAVPQMKQTVPSMLFASNKHWVKDLVVPDTQPITVDITLNAGNIIAGQLLGTDGKPTREAIFSGSSEVSSWRPIEADKFEIVGYYEDKPRELFFYQRSTNTAAYLLLKGKISDAIQVTLRPAATLRGRIVDQDGAPMAHMVLSGDKIPSDNFGDVNYRLATDGAGRFEIRGLVPGQTYSIYGSREGFRLDVAKDVLIDKSEVKDLGEIKLKKPGQN